MSIIKTLEWTDAGVRFIDQTKLPTQEVYVTCKTYEEVADAIKTMIVRAPNRHFCRYGNCAARSNAQTVERTGPSLTVISRQPSNGSILLGIRRMQTNFAGATDVTEISAILTALRIRGGHCRQ